MKPPVAITAKLIEKTGTQASINIEAIPQIFAIFLDSILTKWVDAQGWQSITEGRQFLNHRSCCFTSEECRISITFSQPALNESKITILDTFDTSTVPEQDADFSVMINDLFCYLQQKIETFNKAAFKRMFTGLLPVLICHPLAIVPTFGTCGLSV